VESTNENNINAYEIMVNTNNSILQFNSSKQPALG